MINRMNTLIREHQQKSFFTLSGFWPCFKEGGARQFKSLEFGNGSRMSDENLVIVEFKYLQNKKW